MTETYQKHWRPPFFITVSLILHLTLLVILIVQPSVWRWLLVIFIMNHLVIALVGLWPRSNWLGPNWTQLPLAAKNRNEIALTIDDGPDPLVTPQVLDLLDALNAKVTFFCIGNKVAQYPELCRDIINRGHAIENHSQRHKHHFSLLGLRGISKEIEAAQETVFRVTGTRPMFFRAPAGLRNPFLEPVLNRLGLCLTSWTVRGFDTQVKDVEKVKNKLLSGLKAGSILLMHDGNAARTVANEPVILAVLPSLLDTAKKLNLHFVTLQQASL